MKKKSLLVLGLASLLGLASCGAKEIVHQVVQPLVDEWPTSVVEIHFWHCLGQAKRNNIQQIVDKFNAQFAGKYHVYDLDKDALAGDYSSLASDVTTNLQGGSVPALTMGYPDFFSDLITNRESGSAILKIDSWIDDTREETVDGKTVKYGLENKNDFVKAYYDEGTGYQFKGTWSLPLYKSTEVLYYNQSFFMGVNPMNDKKFEGNNDYNSLKDDATDMEDLENIDEHLASLNDWLKLHEGYTYEVPTTWAEMFVVASQIKKDWDTYNLGSDFIPVGYDSDSNLMITQLAQRKLGYTTNENISKEEDHYLFNNDKTDALVSEIMGYYNKNLFTTKGLSGSYTSDIFAEEKCVMSIGSTGGSTYQDSSSFIASVAPVPCYNPDDEIQYDDTAKVYKLTTKGDESKTVKKYIQQGPSICFFDNENDQINKGAWLFYKALSETENNAKVAFENSYDPVRESSYEDPFYKAQVALGGTHRGLNYDIPKVTLTLRQYYMTSDVFKGSQNARDQIGGIFLKVKNNGGNVRAAVQRAYNSCF